MMNQAKTIIPLTFTVLCLLVSFNAYSKKLYKWKDAEGITQYTEQPPKDASIVCPSERCKVMVVSETTSNTTTEKKTASDDNTETSGATDAFALRNKKNCEIAKRNLAALVNHERVKIKEANGEERYLTAEEMEQRKELSQKQVDLYCEKKTQP